MPEPDVKVVDSSMLAEYDRLGVAPFINDFRAKRLNATVSGNTVAFTDPEIASNVNTCVLEGPFIADLLMGVTSMSVSGSTVTYTLNNSDANGKMAFLWLRYNV